MITVFYRKKEHWGYPQLDFGDGEDYVTADYRMEEQTPMWVEKGLTQSVLADGYDDSIRNVIILRQKR